MFRRIEARIVSPLLGADIPTPSYATDGSAAMDLRACIERVVTIAPGDRMLIGTGIAINMMDPGLVAIVASRSGLSLKHGVRVAQGIGVIDADYHGEIRVILANDGDQPYHVEPGDRIAQLMFQPVVQVALHLVDEFSIETERGEGGFGSTGRH
ncbi:deoxyuridine 5'-triphosphate nucleotidohydrolase [Burkholderia lata]|uniref:dUTP diphosphatase n=1 Tax=Burkholderia lata (strain ATCC 17760 / DSM 23089 / LMG 22485 / NCIMB 9086 / R18194 / 383) TaxID=482957 RepID=UPI001452AAB1|nr:dUTP diphosphatase [Burkholderia lata]VWC05512.1 deoxyuridine 5'-triphosphate nucleotidohydrolase [Burkholderia lata]